MKVLIGSFLKSRITQGGLLLGVMAAVAATVAWTGTETRSYKLEGSWIAKVPGTPVMWTYVLSPDPSGKSAAMFGEIQVPVGPSIIVPGLFPDLEYYSTTVGQMRMTGPDTCEFSSVWYGMKKGIPFNQVVFIGMNNGQAKITAPNKAIGTNHLAFYAPSADADGDGLPDPGQVPVLCLPPSVAIGTRLPMVPPCTP